MKDNLYIRKYNEANNIQTHDELNIYDECFFSLLDILKEKEVETISKEKVSCKCKSSVNYSTYYDKCNKCNGKGKIFLNGNEVICNHCLGKGSIVKNKCPLCDGEGKVIKNGKVTVKLNKKLKEGDIITIREKGRECNNIRGDLIIKVKINDLECFDIKGNDVYDKRMIHFSKEDISKNVSKRVETVKGFVNVKSSGSNVNEVIKLEKEGIDNGDFYICLENELVEVKGKDVYKNIIIDKDKKGFYFDYSELENNFKYLNISYYKKIDENKEYVEVNDFNNFKIVKVKHKGLNGKNGGLRGDLYLRVFFSDEFKNIDDELYHYPVRLTRYELMDGKKVMEFNKSKITLNFEKNLKDLKVVEVKDSGYIINNNSFSSLNVAINPFSYDIYEVSVKVNKKDKEIYLSDYKKYFYEEVKKSNDGLKVSLSKKSDNIVVFDGENNRVNIKIIR